jgi:acetolactate synthase small subunit
MVTALIHNQNGVLNRLIGLITKHQFQIESLAVVVFSEVKEVSKLSVIVEVDGEREHKFLQLVKLVNKQIDVLFVTDIIDQNVVDRELALINKLMR